MVCCDIKIFAKKIIIIICSDIAKKIFSLPIISRRQLVIAIATKILNKSAYYLFSSLTDGRTFCLGWMQLMP